jgi:hypothetical protein
MTLYLTMLRDSASRIVRLGAGAVDVPAIGRCRDDLVDTGNWILCESPLRGPSSFLVVQLAPSITAPRESFFGATSYSPFPANPDSSIVPVGRHFHSGSPDFCPTTLLSLEPVAHFRQDLTLSGVSLADYQILP